MADPKTSLERLIEEHGGKLVRREKHNVFRFPNGVVFTLPKTPSCSRSYHNAAAYLKTLLGAHAPDRGAPGQRREKRIKSKVEVSALPPTLHDVPVSDWKNEMEAVAPVVPPKPTPRMKIIHPQHREHQPPSSNTKSFEVALHFGTHTGGVK